MEELPKLRTDWSEIPAEPDGSIARRMYRSVTPHAHDGYITPMAAVAGAVADEILESMRRAAELDRAYVNNGGDMAFHLAAGNSYDVALADLNGASLGKVEIGSVMEVRGIATSGREGRSFSLGIADSVTVLARTASDADAAATRIANAVDLPGHPAVSRCPAASLDDETDLGNLAVVTDCGPLNEGEIRAALEAGAAAAENLRRRGLICAAALFLKGASCLVSGDKFCPIECERKLIHA